MPSFSRGDVVLVRYPFSDLSGTKVRPAVVVSPPYPSNDLLIVPMTSRIAGLRPGEFLLNDWASAGLRVPTAIKRGVHTTHIRLIATTVGRLSPKDLGDLASSLRQWLSLESTGPDL